MENKHKISIPQEINSMIKELIQLYEIAYEELRKEVEYIIKNKISDIRIIERTFENLLNIPTDKGYKLLLTLCKYTLKIDSQLSIDYLGLYQELYFEGSEKHCKKRKKSN